MKHILGTFLFIFLCVAPVRAAGPIHESDAAFEASQAARNQGVAAFRSGDLEAALTHLEAALALRPNHPLLLGYVAYLAAETGHLDKAEATARRYAALGLVPDTDIRTTLKSRLDKSRSDQLEALFTANMRAIGQVTTAFMLPADMALVEGIAIDDRGHFFFGTVVGGTLYRMDATGPVALVRAADHGLGSFFGMVAHGGSLYATFAHIDETPSGADGPTGIVRIDPETGTILQTWTLAPTGKAQQLADITVCRDGTVFATDAQDKKVYRITGDTLFPLFANDSFMSPQGIAELPDGTLVMADYGRGLWLLDTKSGQTTLIETPETTTLIGIDGLVAHKGSLVAIQNGVSPQRVLKLTLSPDRKTVGRTDVVAQGFADYGEATLGVSTPKGLTFIGGSQWASYGAGGMVKDGADIRPTPVLRLED